MALPEQEIVMADYLPDGYEAYFCKGKLRLEYRWVTARRGAVIEVDHTRFRVWDTEIVDHMWQQVTLPLRIERSEDVLKWIEDRTKQYAAIPSCA